ncbi:MAG: hypothetical protein ABI597_13240 [Gammaproteobacteria bacterium]
MFGKNKPYNVDVSSDLVPILQKVLQQLNAISKAFFTPAATSRIKNETDLILVATLNDKSD